MSRPIPRRLLVHSATLEPYAGTVKSVRTYGTAVELSRVRVDPVRRNAMTSLGDAKSDAYVLFFDAVNSLPAGTEFHVNDRITFRGESLSVREVAQLSGDSAAVHHWEVRFAR